MAFGPPVRKSDSFNFDRPETLIFWLLRNEPFFFSARNNSFLMGSNINPATISFSFSKAIEIQKWGIPCKKMEVPSIGSIIHLNSYMP